MLFRSDCVESVNVELCESVGLRRDWQLPTWSICPHDHVCSTLSGSLEGRGVEGRMDPCLCTADSLHCPPETNTALLIDHAHVCAKSLRLCLTLRDPVGHSHPGSSVHGILQARILEWVVMPTSSGSSQSKDRICISCISCIGSQILYH